MNRRNFIKIASVGAMTLLFGGCESSEKTEASIPERLSVSEGNKMKIVVINSSPHSETESTSRFLAQRFIAGAESSGHEIFVFDAANEETHPCQGCDMCGMNGDCVFSDAIQTKLMPKMVDADLLVLVTPLYYYGMSTQLKTVIDRFYARTYDLNNKKSMLMVTAYNSADWTMEAIVTHYETLVRYMHWQDVGQVLAIGCGSRRLVERSDFGNQAYNIGVNL